ncbi:ClbS/DfsB family four-helix bundle protein [Bacillus sp. 1P06AnD]|uniref:ClbS/DfsB family four-helix bundle protein n=1 Tax=Bacillus sp. 1P06AnD TaxID=3132208 RepID=UPI0039A2A85B
MPRPKTKKELIEFSERNYKALLEAVQSIPEEKWNEEFSFESLYRNIRDVMAHLHEWLVLMENAYEIGMAGKQPELPAPGYTFRTTPELNKHIWEKYQQTGLDETMELLEESHAKMMKIIEGHSDEELFTKKYYNWTGSTSLGQYLISATSSHYDWALKKIKKFKRSIEKG